MQDFKCATHGVFEELLTLDNHDPDARWDAVRSHACPTCGEASPSVWIKAPGLAGIYEHGIVFGGRFHKESDLEEKLQKPSESTSYFDTREFEERAVSLLKKNDEREAAGTLPPAATPDQVQAVASSLS